VTAAIGTAIHHGNQLIHCDAPVLLTMTWVSRATSMRPSTVSGAASAFTVASESSTVRAPSCDRASQYATSSATPTYALAVNANAASGLQSRCHDNGTTLASPRTAAIAPVDATVVRPPVCIGRRWCDGATVGSGAGPRTIVGRRIQGRSMRPTTTYPPRVSSGKAIVQPKYVMA
jgi:hypothetical protein